MSRIERKASDTQKREEYHHLTAKEGYHRSKTMLHGSRLELTEDGCIPDLNPVQVSIKSHILPLYYIKNNPITSVPFACHCNGPKVGCVNFFYEITVIIIHESSIIIINFFKVRAVTMLTYMVQFLVVRLMKA